MDNMNSNYFNINGMQEAELFKFIRNCILECSKDNSNVFDDKFYHNVGYEKAASLSC